MGQKIREEKDDKEHKMWAWLMASKIVHRLGLLPKPYEDRLRAIKLNNTDALHWKEDEEKYWQVVVKDVNSFIAARDRVRDVGVAKAIDEIADKL
ncbi:hypothetical protein HK104_007393 [Borealophlyctis nickersoniae]|nr:hypothetical protein HK104_007393 [Borealophlyctis nickersoniae]